ncbi:MAG: TatD family deoxyribonuclease [Deltaproteobacteria bacterium]|nr:MAG: TatD family deoxyribonuclease [Deltaproteobacteria bacterium]
MFDAHNHLDRCPDPADALAQARLTGVRGQVLAGVDVAGWRRQAAVARDAPDLWCAYGIHPWTAGSTSEEDHGALVEHLVRALDGALGVPPCALGELGLDEARRRGPAERKRQRALFRAQLALARERDLPVVLHVVRAHGAALGILRRDGLPAAGGVVHSASTPPDLVPSYLDLGLHLSFGPALTRHDKARAAAALVPQNRLLVETDAPDQAPAGESPPSSPSCLPRVVAALAEVHGVPAEVMADATAAAARRLYRLPAA